MRQWFLFYSKIVPQLVGKKLKVPQLVGQIPWGHNRLILNKIKDPIEAFFYVQKTIENNWSRDVLAHQIESKLFKGTGKAVNNFHNSIPLPDSDLANQTLKDPYIFDFLTIGADSQEKDLERQLLANITKFLLELGKGFAFVGNQFSFDVNGRDFTVDLLFYNLILRCYIVIDLKIGEFKPEYVGKMNFYLSAVDDKLKMKDDKQTIGIILCRERDKVIAEYALRDVNKPVGISEYRLTTSIPEKLRKNLPSIEDLEITLTRNLQMNSKIKTEGKNQKKSRRGDHK
jgi:predicted nuclease of restriction endonuclease-like (RecB) superfamily